jgi:acyl-CoA synthetase (AMP-forming)/AMP-acid ligase II
MATMNAKSGGPMSSTSNEDYGRRLLPHLVDDIARKDPERECFSFPRSSDAKYGWETVTWKRYANAIDRVAHKIIENCGHPPANTFPTIAYIGPNDPRYVVLLLAAVKAGYKVRHLPGYPMKE